LGEAASVSNSESGSKSWRCHLLPLLGRLIKIIAQALRAKFTLAAIAVIPFSPAVDAPHHALEPGGDQAQEPAGRPAAPAIRTYGAKASHGDRAGGDHRGIALPLEPIARLGNLQEMRGCVNDRPAPGSMHFLKLDDRSIASTINRYSVCYDIQKIERGVPMAETVTIDSAGAQMKLYEVKPEGTAKGAVVVIQEAFGMTDHIMDVCQRLAAEGYLAVAPHVFHRSGDPVIGYDKMQDVVPHIMQLNREGIEADLKASFDYLAGKGFSGRQVAIIGFCMGGSIAFFAGAQWELGAAISFYGAGISQGRFGLPPLIELAPVLKSPFLGNFGDRDQSIPVTEVEALREAAAKSGVATEVNRYPDADHGFHCNDRSSFHEASSKDAWQKTVQFLNRHVQAG
jgi:carboxymethylenebutenolidase